MTDPDLGYQSNKTSDNSSGSSRNTNAISNRNGDLVNKFNNREPIEAYVKFDDFNKRYEVYRRKKAAQNENQQTRNHIAADVKSGPNDTKESHDVNYEQQNDSHSNVQEGWQIVNHTDA